MDLVFIIAFFALLAAVFVYTVVTYYSTSRAVKGMLLVIALIITVPLLGLGIFSIVTSQFGEECKMWALGVCALSAGFWLKNPFRDFE